MCIRILLAACVSRRHTPRSPGRRQFPDRSPKFGIVHRRPFTNLKVPIWNRQNHIFPFTITLTIALIFFRIESFPVIKEFNLCRSSEAFVLEVSEANHQLQPAYAVCTTLTKLACEVEQTVVEEFSSASLLITNEPCPSFSFNWFFFKATSPEPPSTDKG